LRVELPAWLPTTHGRDNTDLRHPWSLESPAPTPGSDSTTKTRIVAPAQAWERLATIMPPTAATRPPRPGTTRAASKRHAPWSRAWWMALRSRNWGRSPATLRSRPTGSF